MKTKSRIEVNDKGEIFSYKANLNKDVRLDISGEKDRHGKINYTCKLVHLGWANFDIFNCPDQFKSIYDCLDQSRYMVKFKLATVTRADLDIANQMAKVLDDLMAQDVKGHYGVVNGVEIDEDV